MIAQNHYKKTHLTYLKQNLHDQVKIFDSGRVSDFESRGPAFDPHKGHGVVSLSKTH